MIMDENNSEKLTCPQCGESVLEKAIKCRFCNSDLRINIYLNNIRNDKSKHLFIKIFKKLSSSRLEYSDIFRAMNHLPLCILQNQSFFDGKQYLQDLSDDNIDLSYKFKVLETETDKKVSKLDNLTGGTAKKIRTETGIFLYGLFSGLLLFSLFFFIFLHNKKLIFSWEYENLLQRPINSIVASPNKERIIPPAPDTKNIDTMKNEFNEFANQEYYFANEASVTASPEPGRMIIKEIPVDSKEGTSYKEILITNLPKAEKNQQFDADYFIETPKLPIGEQKLTMKEIEAELEKNKSLYKTETSNFKEELNSLNLMLSNLNDRRKNERNSRIQDTLTNEIKQTQKKIDGILKDSLKSTVNLYMSQTNFLESVLQTADDAELKKIVKEKLQSYMLQLKTAQSVYSQYATE